MSVATKMWIKLIKTYEYEDPDTKKSTKFAVDDIIELDDELGKSLISLKFAEKTDAPSMDDLNKKIKEDMVEQISDNLSKQLQGIMGDVGKRLEKSIPGVAKDHSKAGFNGFDSEEEWVESLIKFWDPNNRDDPDERLLKTPSGQSTLDSEEGGVLVPETIKRRIWEQTQDQDMSFLALTDQHFTSGQSTKYNTVPETSRKNTFRHAGALAYWLTESAEFTSSTLKWAQQRLELHKCAALFYATDEEMADAGIALGPVFTKKAAEALNWLVNFSFIWGTGAGQPTGIMNSNALIEVALESGQANTTILHFNLNNMYHRMHPNLRSKAVWLAHPDLVQQLEFIRFRDDATTNRPIYMPPDSGHTISKPGYGTMYGRPVIPCEFCLDFGQRGDIIFVDWSQYATLQKKQRKIRSATSIHVRFLFEETAFRFSYRIDGKSNWSSPIEDLHGKTKRSHIVTLASRSGEGSSSGL